MIDTIILYINNIDKYPVIYEKFYNPQKNKNSYTDAYVDKDSGEVITSTRKAVKIYHDYNSVIPIVHRNTLNISSSHYSLSYFLNVGRNRLEFNFSIPKYLFGNNVLQFINVHDQSAYYTYAYLMLFILKFLRDNFTQQPLPEDVEINRIDLCYNQLFNSKGDALAYLDKQKNLLAKFARSSRNRFRTYDTSLMYVTDRYSFKIYHKGTEFKKNDLPEIVKAGNPKKYNLTEFAELSDCMLRYEMTFRNKMIQYLVSQNLWASKKAADYPAYKLHPVSVFVSKCQRYIKDSFFKKGQKTFLEQFKSRIMKFTLRSPFDVTGLIEVLLNSESMTFDKEVFEMLFNRFWYEVGKYQLEQSVSYFTILDRIKEYNEQNQQLNNFRVKRKRGVSTNRLLIPAILSQHYPLDQLYRDGLIPRSTFTDLKRDLKRIGIDSNKVNDLRVNPKLDYSDYKIYFSKYIHATELY